MATVTVLVKGYAHRTPSGSYVASPSTILIRDSGNTVLVDPGSNRKLLQEAMSAHGLTPDGIDLIYLTHYHLDHLLNIGLFPDNVLADAWATYFRDGYTAFKGPLPGTSIRILLTPGHAAEHSSLIVKTERGRCGIAGDVFWWDDRLEQKTTFQSLLALPDPYALDRVALRESRLKLLQETDYIIPGHGETFDVPKT